MQPDSERLFSETHLPVDLTTTVEQTGRVHSCGQPMEDKLLRSQRHLSAAQRLAQVGSWEMETATGTMFWSEEVYTLYGLDPASPSLAQIDLYRYIHPEDRQLLKTVIEMAFEAGTPYDVDHRCIRADGAMIYLNSVGVPVRDEMGSIYKLFGTVQDISDRKRNEKSVQEIEQRFHSALASMQEGLLIVEPEGVVRMCNPAAERILGISASELLDVRGGMGLIDAVYEDGRKFTHDSLPTSEVFRSGLPQHNVTMGIIRDDGSYILLSVSAAPIVCPGDTSPHAAVMTFTDITERRKLEETQRRMASIVECSDDAILTNMLDGIIVSWNTAAERLYGYTADEMIGSLVDRLLAPDHRNEFQEIIARLEHGEHLPHFETVRIHRDGRSIPVSIGTAAIRDTNNNLIAVSTIARDVSQRKYFERKMEQAIQEAQEYGLTLEKQRADLEKTNAALESANLRLEAMATTDGLTGLKNHRAFQEKLQLEFEYASRYSTPLSLLILDVDNFKKYNDTYGHPAGDVVLKEVAMLLQSAARTTDFVARYGGEEFVVVLPQTSSVDALRAAERFRNALENADWKLRSITGSFGATTMLPTTIDRTQMISEADSALYASKAGGRNRVTHHSTLSQGLSVMKSRPKAA